ncbi:hypothetical protein EDB19DRAFT_1655781, partial [Suillus lakei]
HYRTLSVFTLAALRHVVGPAGLNTRKLWYRTDIEVLFTLPALQDRNLSPTHNVALHYCPEQPQVPVFALFKQGMLILTL